MGNYGDAEDHKDMRRAVLKLLRKDGTKQSRGKRPAPNLEAFVESMVPLFLHFGCPLSAAENSALVRGLRILATAMGIDQDPRNEVRRLLILDRKLSREMREKLKRMVADIFLREFGR